MSGISEFTVLATRPCVLRSYVTAVLFVVCLQSTLEAAQSSVLDQGLITLGPSASVEEHIQYIRSTWPLGFAVAIVHLVEQPYCSAPKAENSDASATYCWVEVHADELLVGSWNHLEHASTTKPARFRLHYWHPREETHQWEPGERLVVFLAPTHSYTVYSATAILEATDQIVSHVRNAIRQARG